MFDPLKAKTRLILVTVAAFAVGAGGATALGWTALTATPAITEQPQISEEAVASAVELSEAFVNISQAVTPAVVRIEADRPQRTAQRGPGFGIPDDLLRQWGLPVPPEGREDAPRMETRTAGGSGFIVSPDGYILTNDHVVGGSTSIRVYLQDRREYTATLVGTDPTTDVAVVKIDDRDLPTLSLGSSEAVRVGEWVLAVGNPGVGGRGSGRSLEYTVTAGIVSAIGRPLQLLRDELRRQEGWEQTADMAIEDFIQTDAVINPGNSGGPLVNVRGQVVGINSAIASPTGYFQGYGFAIPIDLARRTMEDLVEYGHVRRPLLGVRFVPVTPEDAEYYGLPRTAGALVQDVPEDGPAHAAGIRAEDVIWSIDGTPIDRSSQLQTSVAQRRPGDRVQVRLYRDGQPRDVTVRLGEAELGPRAPAAAAAAPTAHEQLGLEIAPLDAENARVYGFDEGGVVIRGVDPAGPVARTQRIAAGVKILEINRTPVNTVQDADRLLSEASPGDIVSFRVQQPTGEITVANVRVPG